MAFIVRLLEADMRMKRCAWANADQLLLEYHDKEWGVPIHDDTKLFEFLVLEGTQAGLSWLTILKKRENYRKAFVSFDAEKVARYDTEDLERLLANPGLIRNRMKITAAITNARKFLEIRNEFGSFDRFVWQFTHGKSIRHSFKSLATVPARSSNSDLMSRALQKRGFKFVGSIICYSFMQAVGMVNDHITTCFRYRQIPTD